MGPFSRCATTLPNVDPAPLAVPDTAPLFPALHAEFLTLLRALSPADWERPTVAGAWRVRDVAAHLLDGDLRKLAAHRDGHLLAPDEPVESYADVLRLINGLNAGGVTFGKRLSTKLITDLLEVTGHWMSEFVETLDPTAPAVFGVAWAGEIVSNNRLDTAREYTERWHHQMQMRAALDRSGPEQAPEVLLAERFLFPLLDTAVRALPHVYRDVAAPEGTTVVVALGDRPYERTLRHDGDGWMLYVGGADGATARVTASADHLWRHFFNALPPGDARRAFKVDGPDDVLLDPFWRARSVMVGTRTLQRQSRDVAVERDSSSNPRLCSRGHEEHRLHPLRDLPYHGEIVETLAGRAPLRRLLVDGLRDRLAEPNAFKPGLIQESAEPLRSNQSAVPETHAVPLRPQIDQLHRQPAERRCAQARIAAHAPAVGRRNPEPALCTQHPIPLPQRAFLSRRDFQNPFGDDAVEDAVHEGQRVHVGADKASSDACLLQSMPGQHQLAKAAIDAHTHGPATRSGFQQCSRSATHIEHHASLGLIAIHFLPVVQHLLAVADRRLTAPAFIGKRSGARQQRHVHVNSVAIHRIPSEHFRQHPGVGALASHGDISVERCAEVRNSSDDRIRVRARRPGALKLAIAKGDKCPPASRASKAG